jgi:hypothetical protein
VVNARKESAVKNKCSKTLTRSLIEPAGITETHYRLTIAVSILLQSVYRHRSAEHAYAIYGPADTFGEISRTYAQRNQVSGGIPSHGSLGCGWSRGTEKTEAQGGEKPQTTPFASRSIQDPAA